MKNGFRFSRHYDGHVVKVRLDKDAGLDQLVEALEDFLRGCGYEFSGTLQIVEDED